jgi:hypothetical protein
MRLLVTIPDNEEVGGVNNGVRLSRWMESGPMSIEAGSPQRALRALPDGVLPGFQWQGS